jgi:WD40 repeat protein
MIAVCGEKMPVQIWNLATSKLVKSWQIGPPAGLVSQVAFSPDGHYLATVNGNGTVYVLSTDGVLD